jgi:hypothetical protein
MKRLPSPVTKKIAEIVNRFYNRDNFDVGPFVSQERVLLDVKKEINEKFQDQIQERYGKQVDIGELARQVAEAYIKKCTQEWEHNRQQESDRDSMESILKLSGLNRRDI